MTYYVLVLDAGWIETDLPGRFHSGPGFCLDAADGPEEPNDGRGGVPGKIQAQL
jgi:hypothetical protein